MRLALFICNLIEVSSLKKKKKKKKSSIAFIHHRKIFELRFIGFTGVYSELRSRSIFRVLGLNTCLHSLEEAGWRQVSRGYACSCTSDPAPSIVSRLRKAVLSRIIRLHRIIAYTGRDRRTPVARLHLFCTTVLPAPGHFPPVEGKIDTLSTEVSRTWLEIDQIFIVPFYSKL